MAAPQPPSAPSPTPPRDHFALTGPSVALDPRTHAVRPDLADVRLARHVFAPHYAAPVPRMLTADTGLRAGREAGSEVIATLSAGDRFELLDLIGEDAWGVAPDLALVGYVEAAVLAEPAA